MSRRIALWLMALWLLTGGMASAETEFAQGFALTLPQGFEELALTKEDEQSGFLLRAACEANKLTLAVQWQPVKRGAASMREYVRAMSQKDEHVTIPDMDGIPSDFVYCVEKREGDQQAAFTLSLFSATKNGHVLNCWFFVPEGGAEDAPQKVMQSFRWIEGS